MFPQALQCTRELLGLIQTYDLIEKWETEGGGGGDRERRIAVCDIIKRREVYEVRESEVIDIWYNQDMELKGKGERQQRKERERLTAVMSSAFGC